MVVELPHHHCAGTPQLDLTQRAELPSPCSRAWSPGHHGLELTKPPDHKVHTVYTWSTTVSVPSLELGHPTTGEKA
jgi:hypothetical protein